MADQKRAYDDRMSASKQPPGWYEHPDAPDALRYFDGEEWTSRLKPVESRSIETWQIAIGVAVGILIAAVAIALVVGMAKNNDAQDCANENADRAINGQAVQDCG